MPESESGSNNADNLRKRAEERAHENAALMQDNLESLSPDETKRMIHELRVHQIELEMQNEELLRAQEELETSRARYFDLYDLAPVGYITISEKGLILEANLSAAGLLGVARSGLIGQQFSGFIDRSEQDFYYLRCKQLLQTTKPQAYELRMLRKDGTRFWTQMETSFARDMDGAPVCRAVLSDITERKNAQVRLVEDELRYLSRKMILSQEEERKVLSRELHDSLGQKIISIQLEIEWLKNRETIHKDKDKYVNIYSLTVDASEELQQICMGLRPLLIDRIGFAAAIRALLGEFEKNRNISIDARIMPVAETLISSEITINLYRILQEALSNAVRHSNTKTIHVSLRQEGTDLVLDVRDKGSGFLEDEPSRKYSYGILGMRERANMSGENLEINSTLGKGTHVRVSIPLVKPSAATGA